MSNHHHQAVSFWPATALVITNMIGTGVFLSLAFQVSPGNPNVFPIVVLWVLGGILAFCGALCYAELATALPQSGGEYHFLSRIYHPSIGFCAGLCSVLVGFAAPCAVNAELFGNYLGKAFPPVMALFPRWGEHIIAILLVVGLTLAHLRSLRFTGLLQSSSMFISLFLITLFILAGFFLCPEQPVSFLPHVDQNGNDYRALISTIFWSNLIYVIFSYSGWNAATYIVGEVENPSVNLPRALIVGTLTVTAVYVVLNIVFLYTTPISEIAGNTSFLFSVGQHVLGSNFGARFVSLLMCVGLSANVSAMIWIGSRVSYAIGSHYQVLNVLSKTTSTRVPWVALLVQLLVILIMLLCFDAESTLNYVAFVLTLCSTLTVVGVIVLRQTEPNLPRPYRTLGYPLTPMIFTAVSIACLYFNYDAHPWESIVGTATTLIGIPIYFLAKWLGKREAPAPAAEAS
jgi:APA family basic amino acid/polyamine antiporter